jgi:hypothetical protein
MKRLLCTAAVVFVLLLGLFGTSHALTVTLTGGSQPPAEAFSAGGGKYIVLTFSDSRVVIHDAGAPVSGETLTSREVSLSELFLIQDHRSPSQRTGYETIYSYGRYILGAVEKPEELAGSKGVTLWPVTRSMVVTSNPILAALPDPTVQKLLNLLSRDKYTGYLNGLANNTELSTRYSCSSEALTARDIIANFFQTDAGLAAGTTEKFTNTECASCSQDVRQGFNVIARKVGWKNPEQFYLVGAHYDSINNNSAGEVTCQPAPGACDNASGVAGVLELARVFKNVDTEASIVFVAFGGEEIDLLGSREYVKKLVNSGKEAYLKGFVVLDMISYYKNDYGIYIEASSKSASQMEAGNKLKQLADTYTNLGAEISWKPASSDHVPFLNHGMPGALLIQKECDFKTYPALHSAEDVVSIQNPDFAIEVLKVTAALLAEAKVTFPQ